MEDPDGQEEYSLASSANVEVEDWSLSRTIWASSGVLRRICLAVALMASGGGPYYK